MQTIGSFPSLEEVSLYFHIPFCKRKCDYCHFYVVSEEEQAKDRLLAGFKAEMRLLRPLLIHKRIVTLYFGGGTPSLFGPERVVSLLEAVKQAGNLLPSAEITLEANPDNLPLSLMHAYAAAGINRVSIGVQTLAPELLPLLGRLHSPEMALQAIEKTFQAGIHNISIDLMYDLPKQTLSHWTHTLHQLDPLPITHLSLYNLTIEPHTVFFKKRQQLQPWLPDEHVSLSMYESAVEHLASIGLPQYEISAFARPGYASQHNTGYWTGRPFLGLGPSAFSYWQGKRWRNIAHFNRYCRLLEADTLPIDFEEELSLEAQRRELLVIRLRLNEGVSLAAFTGTHGPFDASTYAEIDHLSLAGLLYHHKDRLLLTQKGVLFYDTVAAALI